jgi:hypothetical protein
MQQYKVVLNDEERYSIRRRYSTTVDRGPMNETTVTTPILVRHTEVPRDG